MIEWRLAITGDGPTLSHIIMEVDSYPTPPKTSMSPEKGLFQ